MTRKIQDPRRFASHTWKLLYHQIQLEESKTLQRNAVASHINTKEGAATMLYVIAPEHI